MPVDIKEAERLADLLCQEILDRAKGAEKADDYYRGKQPLRFASPEFNSYFGERYKDFSDNWVQVVADAAVERLEVIGAKPMGADVDAELWRIWQMNGLDLDSQLGFLGAGNAARSYVLVWGDPDEPDTPVVTFEDATQAIVAYRSGSRRIREAAAKRWQDGSVEFVTLYLPDEVWKFERSADSKDKSAGVQAIEEELREWKLRETQDEQNPQPNPMGVVPMVELPNRPLLAGDPISDVTGVMSMQDTINLLWGQLLVASDFASFAQRVILGAEMPKIPILDSNGQVIGERPVDLRQFAVDRLLWVEDENAKIGEFSAHDLTNYTAVLEVAVGHIAAQTRTPSHYLIGKMSNLSSDALIAAETGLVKKCQEKHLWYGAALREMFALIALAAGSAGDETKAQAMRAGTVLWSDPQSRNQAQLADSLVKLKSIGFPFEYLAAKYGLTPVEVVSLMEMRERDAALDPISQVMNGKPDEMPVVEEIVPDGDA